MQAPGGSSRRTMFQATTAVAVVLIMTHAAAARECFPAESATLLDHVPLNGFPTVPSSGNDCWGYVSPGGLEYALMGLRDAVAVVDLSDPSGSLTVGSISHASSNWGDIKTHGSFAYAVNESGGGLDVIDLSQVDDGVVTLVQRVTEGGLSTCHNIAVNNESGFLYLCAANINEGRLVAMDLSDPANPVIAGEFPIATGGIVHDAQVVTYTEGPYAGREICFASSGSDGLEIYDVTDKEAMIELAQVSYPNHIFTHQCWADETLQYLYVNDELDSVNETVIFDISDLTDPVFIGAYTSGVEATDHNVFYHSGFIFEAEYRAGLRIFDAADPADPVQVGWLDTFPGDDSPGSGGAWGVYPFFPSGKVIVSDKNRGLFVVWPDDPPILYVIPDGPPERINPSGESFTVDITTVDGHDLDIDSPVLVYDAGDGPVEAPMTHLGDDTFLASFAAIECGAIVRFHLRAATTDGVAIRQPLIPSCGTFLAISAEESSTILADEFESSGGWTGGVAGDTASTGQWTRVDPIGTAAQPENDHTAPPGTHCFVTGQGAPMGQLGGNDVDNGFTTLLSPPLDLSGAERVTIGYWRWYHNSFFLIDHDEGAAPNEDVFVVEISDDDGSSWITVETVGPEGPGTAGGWILHALNVGDFVDLTSEVRLRFVASDIGNPSIVEAAIDDVTVSAISCSACPADLDASGDVGLTDLLQLLVAWGSCPASCPEDLDGSGDVGFADLLIILSEWGACP